MRLLSTVIALLFSMSIWAQERAVVQFSADELSVYENFSLPIIQLTDVKLPITDATPFLAFSVVWEGHKDLPITLSFQEKNSSNTPYFEIKEDLHAEQIDNRHVSQLYFIEAALKEEFTIHINETSQAIQNLEIHFYNPSETVENQLINERSLDDCECPQPDFEARLDWCPTGTCPYDPTPVFTDVTHLVVHHSAGPNTASDWAARVRSIWDYHVNSNGWDDIGYNWLIDPNGVLYEGRSDNWQGAHFCGNNGGTVGVCMIGTYIDVEPTAAAMTTLKELLAWKAADRDLDPLMSSFHASSGANLPHILGHQTGCSTTCPGDMLFARIPDLREDVFAYWMDECSDLQPPSEIEASLANNTTVGLTWVDNADDETGYRIERKEAEEEEYQEIITLPANETSYLDMGLLSGKTYYYHVVAVNAVGVSTCQLEVDITMPGTNNTSNISSIEGVKVAPNPMTDFFHIQLENEYRGSLQIELFDITGKMIQPTLFVEKNDFYLQQELNMKQTPVGVYWLRISQGNLNSVIKLIKQ